ncbi:MAG: endonuclease/exonuclease/phosphatase family protein [Marinilabiliaceae bacterium]|nr:endonuclease/exonuclease/phosphatase family protein [Marinilabiliaceae bacterium]
MLKKLIKNLAAIITFFSVSALLISASTSYINPIYLNVLVFTGFIFPAFWVFNLIVLIFNAIRKYWKLFSLGLITAIITFSQLSHVYQIKGLFEEPQKKDQTIKVMSFNTRMFDYYKWTGNSKTNENVFDFIRKQNPDIVCFQEFFSYDKKEQFAEHHVIARLNQFPYHHIEYNIIAKTGRRFGQATFSKYPIIAKKPLKFEGSSNFSIQTDIKVKDKTIRIFNNHLESIRLKTQHYHFLDSIKLKTDNETKAGLVEIFSKVKNALKQRANQSKTIANHIKNSPYPTIVCGDFNDTPVSFVYHTMKGDLKDSFIEAGEGFQGTYNGKLPSFRIDFIFHDQSFHTYKFKTYKKNFSDHFPIIADIKL